MQNAPKWKPRTHFGYMLIFIFSSNVKKFIFIFSILFRWPVCVCASSLSGIPHEGIHLIKSRHWLFSFGPSSRVIRIKKKKTRDARIRKVPSSIIRIFSHVVFLFSRLDSREWERRRDLIGLLYRSPRRWGEYRTTRRVAPTKEGTRRKTELFIKKSELWNGRPASLSYLSLYSFVGQTQRGVCPYRYLDSRYLSLWSAHSYRSNSLRCVRRS